MKTNNTPHTLINTGLVFPVLMILVLLAAGCSQEPEPAAGTEAVPGAELTEPAVAEPGAGMDALAATGASAPVWSVDYENSTLDFEGDYAGTGYNGRFQEFTAMIRFDPDAPEDSSFDVSIDITSVTTFNDEWDSVLVGRDWFWFSKYPQSRYVTRSFEAHGDNRYTAYGVLELKGRQHEVELNFTWETQANGDTRVTGAARLLGESIVNRLDFGIGEGEYATDSNIRFDIQVKVDLMLSPAPPE